MRIQIASDLHLEMPVNRAFLEVKPLIPEAEVLVLAGDIFYLNENYFPHKILDTWSREFEQVLIVPGNHEFYGKLYPVENIFPSFDFQIQPSIHYLNNKVKIIDNVRFVFTTLFTEISGDEALIIRRRLNDFHTIKYQEDGALSMTIKEYNKAHMKCRIFLEKTLSNPFEGKTVVITHHVPFPVDLVTDDKGFKDQLVTAYHVDMTSLVKEHSVDHWISGHNHHNHAPIKIGGTQFHTNQLGYVEHNQHGSFNHKAVIEL